MPYGGPHETRFSIRHSAAGADRRSIRAGSAVTTQSGLRYIDHKVGTGDLAVLGAIAETHFEGWVAADDKKVKKFDSSIDRGKTYSFTIGVLERGNFRASMKACKV